MNNTYFGEITKVLKQAHPRLATTHKLEFKNCFGAVAGYVDDAICISCGKFGIALKLPKEVLDELFKEKGVTHLKYFAKGHIKKEYAVIPHQILENQVRFKKLLDASLEYTLSASSKP